MLGKQTLSFEWNQSTEHCKRYILEDLITSDIAV